MRIITAGASFLDIDAYAGCIAYAELLNLEGDDSVAISTAPLNESITPTVRNWNATLATEKQKDPKDTFTLIDVSDPDQFDGVVQLDRVDEVIDHHPGFESYWHDRLGGKAIIEPIGAACTLVFEQWQKRDQAAKISQTSARLLLTGILDNTLNFEAQVTIPRDHAAYDELLKHADLPADWAAQYFSECQTNILADVRTALRNDTKEMAAKTGLPQFLGQIVIWDARDLLVTHQSAITDEMRSMSKDWAVNVVSISEGKNYILAEDEGAQSKMATLLVLDFIDGVAHTDRLWLRKEILQAALNKQ